MGLFLLGSMMTITFVIVGTLTNTAMQRATSRNIHVQTLAMSHELERVLDAGRDQLLILAAGPMDRSDLARRLKIRSHAPEGPNFRELAFLGVTPENRFLLLSYGGEVTHVPAEVVRDARGNPFQAFAAERRPGHVVVSRPQEVTYSMVPVNGIVQSLTIHCMRMTTPVHDEFGNFQGLLILSLDVAALRDALSLFTSSRSPLNAGEAGPSSVRSLFFEPQGWVLFQSESPDAKAPPLSTDAIRNGVKGDLGHPDFSIAFRPGEENENFWKVVTAVREERSGQDSDAPAQAWSAGQPFVEIMSYAPVRFKGHPGGQPLLLGGVATLDINMAAARTSLQTWSTFATAGLALLLAMGMGLWFTAWSATRPVRRLARSVEAGASEATGHLDEKNLPPELARLQDGVNLLLDRIQALRAEETARQAVRVAAWKSQPTPLPEGEALAPPLTPDFVGSSPAMQELRLHISKAAAVFADVLLIGETGTGKEMAADLIHHQSANAAAPFISINCGALDESLLMDTLFGHVRGAFTEAKSDRKGAFLAAEGGTLLLDEIGNASPKVQQALLRALSTRRIRPLGCDQEQPFHARIIAATNVDLLAMARAGEFREDLYYRLAVITIKTPPLREHKSDIPQLASRFLRQAAASLGRPPAALTRGALEHIVDYDWPGNVRELRNTLTRALTFTDGDLIFAESIVFGDAALPTLRGRAMPEAPPAPVPQEAPAQHTASPARAHAEPGGLNRRQKAALPLIAAQGGVTRQEYQDMTPGGISMRTAQYDLQEMVRLGLLRKEGRGPASRYVPTKNQA